MEINGIKINENFQKNIVILEEKLSPLKINFKQAEMPFNANSPKQLGEVLFDVLKIIENPKKTKTGQYQTGEEILSELAIEHKIVSDIQNYRQLVKLKSTYVDALPDEICKISNRIHTTFSQSITSTGHSPRILIYKIFLLKQKKVEIRKSFLQKELSY